jgi:hypothetical protein
MPRNRKNPNKPDGNVYFIRAIELNLIKIGSSCDVKKRRISVFDGRVISDE